MQRSEGMKFIEEQMRPRWPDWNPNGEQMSDWAMWLSPYDYATAKNAIREHAGSSRFNKRPNPATLRALLAKFQPRKEQVRKEQPEDTVFVLYAGGGIGTLQPGYFFPIIVKSGNLMQIAEQVRQDRATQIGGEWRVYSETTHGDMAKVRREIRAEITNKDRRKD